MFSLDANGVYRSSLLSELPWVRHGFGTRQSEGWPGRYKQVKQIHSNLVVEPGALEGDALVSSAEGTLLGIRTADCVPILIAADEVKAVAAVHAGWRGTSGEIVALTVKKLTEGYGADAGKMRVAIGPAIGKCCYEVGTEVLGELRAWLTGGGNSVDLVEINRLQLSASGVKLERVDCLGLCTKCNNNFHSYRRDKELSGRMVSAIGVTAKKLK